MVAVAGAEELRPRLTPVTLGDAVIEPFFDGTLGAWHHWTLEPGDTAPFEITAYAPVEVEEYVLQVEGRIAD